ncbi:MAG: ammonium transporter, partial [Methylococcales bacterium]
MAAFVLLMQAGFTCLETGMVRSKNSINVAIKNLMDLCLSSAIFWAVGYGIMFGSSNNGLIGNHYFFFDGNAPPKTLAFFVFQMMFCGTAVTIISGAVAERMSFSGYMLVSAVTSIFIYPIIGRWAWAGVLEGQLTGWLGKAGFIDFAGSTVVHSVGGWVALAAILIIGPRTGRFDNGERKIQGSNLPLSILGVILLWFGWFGFNGGSTLAVSDNIPLIIMNTCLAAVFGGLSAIITEYWYTQTVNVISAINGVLGGLVAITASCHLMLPLNSVVIAIIAGVIVVLGSRLLAKYQIDDAIDVIPVHLFCGVWGTLAVAIFADEQSWHTGLNFIQQLSIQLIGIIVIGIYSFVISYYCLKWINAFYPLRVSLEAELTGLNVSEHNASTEILDLFNDMATHSHQGDFSNPVSVEPFTEAGQIAQQYNHVLSRVNDEITQREEAISSFKTSESRRDAILATSLDCIVSIDKQGLILEFNPAAEKCFGYSQQRIKGRNFIDYFVPDKQKGSFKKSLEKHFTIDNRLSLDRHNKITLLRMHDVEFNAELTITRVVLSNSHHQEFNLHIRDISQQIKLQKKMTRLAYHDPLTDLYNRNFFLNKLQQEIDFSNRHESSVTLMFLDLDQFKSINDNLGHKAGDAVLQVVAKRLNKVIRDGDVICRWGGDEFILLFPGLSKQSVIIQKAEDVLNTISAPFNYQGTHLAIRTSIGITQSSRHNSQQEQLVQQADMALYSAKGEGKNTFCFFMPEMEETIKKKFFYEAELRIALEQDQFFMVYQPKVNCQTNHIQSMEALLRWKHPKEGLISPAIFIPILEESTLMEDVTQWILGTVCQQIAIWKKQALCDFYVAINISGRDFSVHNFVQQVEQHLLQHQVAGHYIEFEITETVLASNTEQCIDVMNKIKKLGIRFAIDDFGTGYSSMSYLKKFPVDTLKIDKAFIDYCDSKKEDTAICTAIISLAKSLHLELVAEGVETDSQLQFLKKKKCDMYQGYLFSRPLSVLEVYPLLLEAS